jgi:hypothetical protein
MNIKKLGTRIYYKPKSGILHPYLSKDGKTILYTCVEKNEVYPSF